MEISSFSGLTPTDSKIVIQFDAGRSGGEMNVKIPVYTTLSKRETSVLGGDSTLKTDAGGKIYFLGDDTGAEMKNGKWEKYSIVIDTEMSEAYLYMNGKLLMKKSIETATGLAGMDFSFSNPDASAAEWYIGSCSIETQEQLPDIQDDDDKRMKELHFDGLRTNEEYCVDGVSYVNLKDNTKDVFKMEAKSGLFGKHESDVSLAIANTSDAVSASGFSSGDADERYHALKLNLDKPGITAADTVLFETEIAVDTLTSTKSVKAAAYTGTKSDVSMGKLIEIDTRGYVEVLGTMLRYEGENVKVTPRKWYNVKIVFSPGKSGKANKFSVYWDGIKVVDNADFRINNSLTANVFGGLSSLEAGYNIKNYPDTSSALLSDGSYSGYRSDGLYLDNMVYSVYKGGMPPVGEVKADSYDPYYLHTIDNGGSTVYDYNQSVSRFIDKLNIKNDKKAEFVTDSGAPIRSGSVADASYLRIEADDGDYIYLKVAKGEDEYLLSLPDINADNKWNRDLSGFYEYEQPDISKLKGSALDASYMLDAPAGKYGFVQRDGDEFVCVDESSQSKTPIRFWGTNIGGAGAFPDTHEEADMIADSIAAAGFNIVRVHNIDGTNRPNIFGNAASGKQLDSAQMDKLCYLLYAFKQRGIYYFIDQTCGRQVFADDNLPDAQYLTSGFKGVCYYDEDIITILEDYSQMYLSYVNPYTGMALKDDPAMACIDLNNENLLFSFDFDSIRGSRYYTELKEMYNQWLVDKYETRSKLYIAWLKPDDYMRKALEGSEDPTKGTVEITNNGSMIVNGKNVTYTPARYIDEMKFIGEIMQKYFERRTAHLRALGVRCAITGNTCWGDVMPEIWYANSKTDFIDTHLYWSHRADGENLLTPGTRFNTNNRYTDAVSGENITGVTSNLTADGLGFVGQMATNRVYGMPYTISEWKECPSNPYLAEGPLLVAAYGSMQGWNPLDFIFEAKTNLFTQIKNGGEICLTDVFASAENPVLRAMYPSVAAMFLRKDVKEAESGYYYNYADESEIYFAGMKDGNRVWQGRHLFPELGNYGLIGKTGVSFGRDNISDSAVKGAADAATNGDKIYTSQTGELVTDLKNGIFQMNTDKSQAVCGFIGGQKMSLNQADVTVDNEFATVILTALSNSNLADSEKLLLTMVGDSVNHGQLLSEDGTTLKKSGKYPIMTEQITGEIEIKLSGNYVVYPLTSSGERKEPLPVTKTADGFRFSVVRGTRAMNFEIVKE